MTDAEELSSQQKRLRLLVSSIAIAVLLLTTILAFLFREQAIQSDRLRQAEISSQERRADIAEIFSAHQDIETGQRGYLLTGNEEFLEPFFAGQARLLELFPAMRTALAGQQGQLDRLDKLRELSEEKIAFSEEAVRIGRAGNFTQSRGMISSGRGKRLMDELRLVNEAMLDEEMRELEEASARSSGAISRQRWGSIIAFGAMLFLLFAAGLAIRRSLEDRYRALLEVDDVSRRREAILDGAMDAIVIVNPSGSIESVNRSAVGMFGYTDRELKSRDVGTLFASEMPIGAAAQMLRELELEPGEAGEVRTIIGRRKGGSTFPTDVALSLVRLTEGSRFVAVIRDVTERDRIDRMKSEFVSTVSHELRTPLTSIAGSLGLLAGGAAGELEEKAARLVEIARNNAERLVRLINDILDVEKLEAGRMPFNNQLMDLRSVIEAAMAENAGYAEKYGVQLSFERPDGDALASIDPDRMAQVLGNLISNAIKFSPSGETVEIILEPGPDQHRLTVADHGPGIPSEFRARLFQKFAQADSSDSRAKGGTGLGLSIVREIVNRMGGAIEFESEEGDGTRVHVDVPATAQGSAEAPLTDFLLLCGEIPEWALEALRSVTDRVLMTSTIDEVRNAIDGGDVLAIILDMALPGDLPARIIRLARSRPEGTEIPIFALGSQTDPEAGADDPALLLDWLHKPGEVDLIQRRIDTVMLAKDGSRPRVLHIDDDPDILRVVATALEGRAIVESIDNFAEARTVLASESFDLLILDLTLRDGYGPHLIDELPSSSASIPIIVFSAEDADGRNAAAFDAFLTKSRTPIRKLVEMVEDLTEREGRTN